MAKGYIDGKQVKAYRDEDRVADDSNTRTFVSGKLTIDNFRMGSCTILYSYW